MRTIGFRAEKLELRWVVIEGDSPPLTVVDEGDIKLGESRPIADELVLLRTAVLNVLKTYKPSKGAVRICGRPPGMGNIQSLFTRARIEGVVLEAAASIGMPIKASLEPTVKAGMKAGKSLSEYASQDEVRGIDMTARGRKNSIFKDAVFAAISVM